jgi:hypothetical protein
MDHLSPFPLTSLRLRFTRQAGTTLRLGGLRAGAICAGRWYTPSIRSADTETCRRHLGQNRKTGQVSNRKRQRAMRPSRVHGSLMIPNQHTYEAGLTDLRENP